MADEALTCFTSLLDRVPAWIATLESIALAAKGRQQDLFRANHPASPPTPGSRPASKTSSLKSSRPNDDVDPNTSPRTRPALKFLSNSETLRLSQRRRKTASVSSGDRTGSCKFRNRAAAVVYYDGEVQQRFEQLVRSIGTSRNAIRKGKMSAKVDALSREGSICSDSGSCSEGEDGDFSKIASDFKYRARRSRAPAFGRTDDTEAFDRVDGRLEKAQALCERAAHQVLRDGDCTMEVINAKEHFSEALTMATAEIPTLRKNAEKAAARRRRSAEAHRLEEEVEAALRATKPDHVKDDNVPPAFIHTDVPNDGDLEVDTLEVDHSDSDSDNGEFDISSFRFTKAGGRLAPPLRMAPRVSMR